MNLTSDRSLTLDRIRAAGVLRVGTTGDYTPFSLIQPDGSYRGADIDMAHDFAATLGVRLQFVPTVWVDLLDDFLAGKFDIAMGGVTVTAARAERAFFSVPTFVDGKRPLCRREDRDRFTSVAAIDQPGVRVIANPGSANEAFARANFTRAEVTIHHDNASVFLEIVAGRADVMVTDGLEADHQAAASSGIVRGAGRRAVHPARKGLHVRARPGDEGVYRRLGSAPPSPAAPGSAR